MQLDAFDFDLPAGLIAQHPPAQRGEGRLLTLNAATGARADRRFSDLPHLLQPNDVLVFNDTRVIKARLFGHKGSGGRVEVLGRARAGCPSCAGAGPREPCPTPG